MNASPSPSPLTATIPHDGELTSAPLASVITPDVPDADRLVAADSMTDAHDAAARFHDYEEQINALRQRQRELATKPGVHQVDRFTGRVKGGRGYLLTDDRNSGGDVVQVATLTCAHCNCVKGLTPDRKIIHAKIFRDAESGEVAAVHMLPAGDPGFCSKCHAYLCDDPVCNKYCTPLARSLEYNLPIGQRPGRETWAYDKGVF